MALFHGVRHIAARLSVRAEVATVDHGLRTESAADAAFVAAQAGGAHVTRLTLPTGSGVEARGRVARYEALHQIREKQGLEWLLTAHTASDQAETVMMRLMRGTALGGSASIHQARADFVARPLLFATRADIESYLAALNAPWRRDEMNEDPQFQRVRVRQTVVPPIEAAWPGATRALARFATLASEDDAHLNRQARNSLTLISFAAEGSLDRAGLCSLEAPIARRVMAMFLSRHGVALDADLIADCLLAARQKRDATLPQDQVLTCTHRVFVVPAPARHIHQTSSSVNGRRENS
jgi:tRNA(Ile)-lysidine synthase